MDLIDRQQAIDAIEEQDIPEDMCVFEILSHIELAIGTLPSAQPEQKWIPCSERLPDNRVDVLICYRVWQQYAKRYVYAIVNGWYARKHSVNENVFSEWEGDCDYKEDEDEFYIQEGWYEFTTQGNGDLMNWYIGGAEVVAWMPLPEPYKEGGADG